MILIMGNVILYALHWTSLNHFMKLLLLQSLLERDRTKENKIVLLNSQY